jgi:hypothetical protein
MKKAVQIIKGECLLVFSGHYTPEVPGNRDVPTQQAQYEPDSVYLVKDGIYTSLTQLFNELELWGQFDEELQLKAEQ